MIWLRQHPISKTDFCIRTISISCCNNNLSDLTHRFTPPSCHCPTQALLGASLPSDDSGTQTPSIILQHWNLKPRVFELTTEGEAKARILFKMFLRGRTKSHLYPSVLIFWTRILSHDPNLSQSNWNVPESSETGNRALTELCLVLECVIYLSPYRWLTRLRDDLFLLSHQLDAWIIMTFLY